MPKHYGYFFKDQSDYPADANYVVKLILHRKRLIRSSYDWNKIFISELKGINHDFDLIEILPDYYLCLKKIFYRYLSFYKHSLYELINYINEKKSELNMSGNSLMVIFNSPSYGLINGENKSLEYQVVPFPQIIWLSNLLNEVKS